MTLKPTTRILLALFVALAGVRLLLIGQLELAPDEAYYAQWSEHLDICYYSKGPGVALAIWIGTHLMGMTETGVRLLSPLLGLGTGLLAFFFVRRLY